MMKPSRCALTLACLLGLWAGAVPAMTPVAPVELTLTQPDGTTFKAYPRGSGYADWIETADGHTILRSGGAWYYARVGPDGALEATGFPVGSLPPTELEGLPKHLRPPVDTSKFTESEPRFIPREGKIPLATNQRTVAILVEFTDISFMYSDASFQSRIFGAAGSVKAFYAENSYGVFSVIPAAESYGTADDGIIHVTLSRVHPNFGGDTAGTARDQLFRDAVLSADPYINYAAFDANGDGNVVGSELAIVIIVAGYETAYASDASPTPNVWAHYRILGAAAQTVCDGKGLRAAAMWGERHATDSTDVHQATVGIMAHECGHLMLGLPDLYDRDGDSEGIGWWGLMGTGNWTRASGWLGSSPAHLTGWDKATVGFVTPDVITAPTSGVRIDPTDSFASVKRIWVDKYRFGESFLLESRRRSNFDSGLPGEGLLITHGDDRVMTQNDDQAHKLVDVEEADGLNQLDAPGNRGDAGDPWPGSGSYTTFTGISTPNTRDYTALPTGVAVTGIAAAGDGAITADVIPRAIVFGDNIGYDETGYKGWGFGCSATSTTYWTGLRVLNTTSMGTLDGLELALGGAATVDVSYYASLSGGIPSALLYRQTGFSGVAGWNRLLFSTPQSFPPGQERGIVVKIQSASVTYPARFDNRGLYSGRSYGDCDGTGTFASIAGDWNQRALFSGPAAPPGVPSGITGTPMLASKNGTDISVTWDTGTCAGSNNYTLIYGQGTQLPSSYAGTYGVTGAKCNIGAPPYTWSDSPDPADNPRRLYWWLIVAHDGAGTEGSWGRNSGPNERTGPGTGGCSGFCSSAAKSTSSACGSD